MEGILIAALVYELLCYVLCCLPSMKEERDAQGVATRPIRSCSGLAAMGTGAVVSSSRLITKS
jgi:hypothetical protein